MTRPFASLARDVADYTLWHWFRKTAGARPDAPGPGRRTGLKPCSTACLPSGAAVGQDFSPARLQTCALYGNEQG